METPSDTFSYQKTTDILSYVRVKIGTLEGIRVKPTYRDIVDDPILKFSGRNQDRADLIARCLVWSTEVNREISLMVQTSYKAFTTRWDWNEWLELPIRYCDLPRDAQLLITIVDCEAPNRTVPVGGTSVHLFGNKSSMLRQGIQDLRVWPDSPADPDSTPGRGPLENIENDQMYRLKKLIKTHELGQKPHLDWLDRLTFRQIELINDKEKKDSDFMNLMIELEKFEKNVMWWDQGADKATKPLKRNILVYYDPDSELENLSELKHRMLTRSIRSKLLDRDEKPNPQQRDILFKIMEYPPNKTLTNKEQDIIWKYRYFASSHKQLLTKFLRYIDFESDNESKQALEMLPNWSPPDAHEALELLGPNFTEPNVRHYAVERLSHASDEDLLLYILQLVQALQYEPWDVNSINMLDVSHYSFGSDSSSVINTGLQITDSINAELSSLCMDECEALAPSISQMPMAVPNENAKNHQTFPLESNPIAESDAGLASFLIRRACQNPILANYLYWYINVECEGISENDMHSDTKVKEMYMWVMRSFRIALQQGSAESKATWQTLSRQHSFVNSLMSVVKLVCKEGNRVKKIEKMKELLTDPESLGGNLLNFEPLPLPLDPQVMVTGVVPEKVSFFRSALEPCKLTFTTSSGSEYTTIFKYGDDLRQDQLIIQLITLMDTLLQQEGMDLKLTPYRVLATNNKHGFVQFIESCSINEAIRNYGSIQNFFKKYGGCEEDPYGISQKVMDTYIKSCAGYCVITYLLGIGDRHSDNLLLTKEGHLFHIDFGYILGNDPKPFPPPMKLSKEMVEAMGGPGHYNEFKKLCYTAYIMLRRHAKLFLNLFSLMVGARVPDIALDPDKTVRKVEDKFNLDYTEEEAIVHFKSMLESSAGAIFPLILEQFHKMAMYLRK